MKPCKTVSCQDRLGTDARQQLKRSSALHVLIAFSQVGRWSTPPLGMSAAQPTRLLRSVKKKKKTVLSFFPSFPLCECNDDPFYQDWLGINIKNTQKPTTVYAYYNN